MSATKQKFHAKVFDAQIELANKKYQVDWKIKRTENGWFVVVREPYPDEASRDWFRGIER